MSLNLEMKAKLSSADAAHDVARRVADGPPRILKQTDTYFSVGIGRLKLRQCTDVGDELIYYLRPDLAGNKQCMYWRCPVESSEQTRKNLGEACGIDATVRKTRTLLFRENVRIHIDCVDGLGDFLEFEAVLTEESDRSRSQALLDMLAQAFNLRPEQYMRQSYRELVQLRDLASASKPNSEAVR